MACFFRDGQPYWENVDNPILGIKSKKKGRKGRGSDEDGFGQ